MDTLQGMKIVGRRESVPLKGYTDAAFWRGGTNAWGVCLRLSSNFKSLVARSRIVAARDIEAESLLQFELTRDSSGQQIFSQLGEKAVVEFSAIAATLVGSAPQGNNRWWLFLVADPGNLEVIWAVFCHWVDSTWYVEVFAISYPGGWSDGRQVFSREPLESSELAAT